MAIPQSTLDGKLGGGDPIGKPGRGLRSGKPRLPLAPEPRKALPHKELTTTLPGIVQHLRAFAYRPPSHDRLGGRPRAPRSRSGGCTQSHSDPDRSHVSEAKVE